MDDQLLMIGCGAGALAADGNEPLLRIMFPPNGARLELASGEGGRPDPIALKVTGFYMGHAATP